MKVDKQIIIDACMTSLTMSEASSKVDINCQTFKKYAKQLGVWKTNIGAAGTNKPKSDGKGKYALEDILNGKYPQYSSSKLRLRLIKSGIKQNICELCGLGPIWNGKPLSLQLDHIDGNHYNQALSNLRIICPNCHTQTDTHGSKKIKHARLSQLVEETALEAV